MPAATAVKKKYASRGAGEPTTVAFSGTVRGNEQDIAHWFDSMTGYTAEDYGISVEIETKKS